MKSNKIKYIVLSIFFLSAFLERTVFDLGPNIELVTASIILASFYFGRHEAFWLTLLIIAFSDRVIGNSSIFLFTWSGFLIPTLFSVKLIKKVDNFFSRLKINTKIASLIVGGFSANLFFFVWTNYGVWALDSFGMYANNIQGLILCYINAIPFFKNQIISTLIFVTVGYFAVESSQAFSKKLKFKKRPSTIKTSA